MILGRFHVGESHVGCVLWIPQIHPTMGLVSWLRRFTWDIFASQTMEIWTGLEWHLAKSQPCRVAWCLHGGFRLRVWWFTASKLLSLHLLAFGNCSLHGELASSRYIMLYSLLWYIMISRSQLRCLFSSCEISMLAAESARPLFRLSQIPRLTTPFANRQIPSYLAIANWFSHVFPMCFPWVPHVFPMGFP
jgi:hypothetical protein